MLAQSPPRMEFIPNIKDMLAIIKEALVREETQKRKVMGPSKKNPISKLKSSANNKSSKSSSVLKTAGKR